MATNDFGHPLGWAEHGIQTLAEEILFRGLIAGFLIRRLGFPIGNMLQAVVFVLPHLLVLGSAPELWPGVVHIFVGGLLAGWLLHRSGSVLPGWIVHFLGAVASATLFPVS